MKLKYILCLLICSIFAKTYSLSLKFYTVDRELSSSLIYLNYQDKIGNIWIATEDGLNRYDGAKFKVYKNSSKDIFSLNANSVHYICEISRDNFFIGTNKGLQLFDRPTDKFLPVPIIGKKKDIQEASVRKIIKLSDGSIIVGTSGFDVIYRIIKVAENKYEAHAIDGFDLPNNMVLDMFEDHEKNLWISMESGILVKTKNNKVIKKYFYDKEMTLYSVTSICQDIHNNIYIGTLGKGIFMYNKQKDEFEPITYGNNADLSITTLYNTDKNDIYIGTDGAGLKILDTKTKQIKESNIKIPNQYLDNLKVTSILKDHAGNYWIGYYQKGLMMIPNITNQFKYIGPRAEEYNIVGANSISAIYKDNQGRLLVGSDNDGLYITLQNKLIKHITSFDKSGLNTPTVISFFKDSNNDLWLGTYISGLIKMNLKNQSYIKVNNPSTNRPIQLQKIYGFAEDKDKRLWIGTMGSGLHYLSLQDGSIHNMNIGKGINNKLENIWIDALFYSKKKNKLYIGTCDGLECLDLNTMSYEPLNEINKILDHVVIVSIIEDNNGIMWLGTSEGLAKVDKKGCIERLFTTDDGLPSNSIRRVELDNNNNLWISMSYGLSKFDTNKNKFLNFYSNNGLQGNEFSRSASFKDSEGNIYFGGLNGITYFNPNDITPSKQEIEVFISDFYLLNKAVKKGMKSGSYDIIDKAIADAEEINLCHHDNSFTIEFSNLEFNNNEHICYQYSINDGKWVSLQNGVNSVSFSDFACGKYDIKYRAKNYDSYSQVKTIRIIIHPAWYASVPAKLVYLLLLIGLIYFIFYQIQRYYKVQQEIMKHVHAKEINETKLQFFINISHEIRTPMSLIIGPLQKLINTDKDSDRQKSYKLIYNNSRRILQLINQLMDLRKIDKGQMTLAFAKTDMIAFIEEIYRFFQYQADNKNISFNFIHQDNKLDAWIDPTNFDKIIFNLLSNAFKYTPAYGTITISVEKCLDKNNNDIIQLIVSDDGESINKEDMEKIFERFYQIPSSTNSSKMGTGIGLHLTRLLVELHHGTIGVQNNPEEGCKFIVNIPSGCSHLKEEEIINDGLEPIEIEKKQLLINPEFDDNETLENDMNKSKSHYRIMVVEDDEEIKNYISNELSSSFHIIKCSNGKEALATILSKKPDLVISDVMMPEMDGITLCKKIKLNVNINYIPVVLLTAKCREEDNIEGLGAGADAYITKPFNIDILHNTVSNILKNREVLRNCFTGNQEQEERQPKFEIKTTDNKLLDRIMNVINKNISNPELSVNMIATEVGISRVHLHRKLKELTNQTTRDLIRNTRLKQAVTLLESKQYNVSEVALMTGFSNITIFSRAFKELYGLSPMNYINNKSNTDEEKPNQDQSENM